MKKAVILTSALAITAAISIAMSSKSKVINPAYCVAHTPGSISPTAYSSGGGPSNPSGTTCTLTILRAASEDPTYFTVYGFVTGDPELS